MKTVNHKKVYESSLADAEFTGEIRALEEQILSLVPSDNWWIGGGEEGEDRHSPLRSFQERSLEDHSK